MLSIQRLGDEEESFKSESLIIATLDTKGPETHI